MMFRGPRLLVSCPAWFARLLALSGLSLGLLATGDLSQAQSFLNPGSGGAVVQTAQARTELIAHAPEGVVPGQTLWAGLRITHAKDWHTYWKNPGDSGLPTELQWTLPPGITAGAIDWPVPRKFAIGSTDPLINYGYDDTVLLPVPLTVAADFRAAPGQNELTLQLQASWLICRSECIPEEGRYTLRIPLRGATTMDAAAFAAARQVRPRALPLGASRLDIEGQALKLTVAGLPDRLHGQRLDAFPETAEVLNPSAPWTQAWQGGLWTATLPISHQRSASPTVLPVVLSVALDPSTHGNAREGWRLELPVRQPWPEAAAPTAISPALQAALDANRAVANLAPPMPAAPPASSLTFLAALALAVLGGLILNLMPCVLPILAIKVLGFAQHAQDRRALRLGGLAYTAGVLLSVLALGLVLLGLRGAGESLGWGFQLQSPAMVAALAALFTVIALNLAGLFEFGQMAPGRLAALQARHPMLDALLTGVLAVVVASPCTAPFMGAALGLAATLPAHQALAIFAALGLGLALPYLVASFIPAVARLLPRPGLWMLTLRRMLAFPMLLTVVWLVWVLGHQSGVDGAATLLVLLVLLSALIWALTLHGRTRLLLAALLLITSGWFAATFGPSMFTPTTPSSQAQSGDEHWQAWSPAREQALLAEGRAVFVDYTAAWCVTCQVNKRTTLNDAQVLKAFTARNVVLLRADWTRRDPAIGAALTALGRSGVPVYVLHRPGVAPLVLSELLSPGEVQRALDTL
ncbi:protein-disulfide reductase DsbD family protein [Hylemonella gracilis]|uniref:protein-disulfide reductase DsbD family protein n=1 Tax=Hylemonella gracilis TaxID=80880 RepID=UPI000AB376E8|nr:thioredoxin family protein [Hylemonella gracilis]